jgi:hypothetical protein
MGCTPSTDEHHFCTERSAILIVQHRRRLINSYNAEILLGTLEDIRQSYPVRGAQDYTQCSQGMSCQ